MSRIDSVGSGLEGTAGTQNNVSGVIGEKETKVTELLEMSNSSEEKGNIFEGLSRANEDGSVTFSANHPVLDGHFGNEDGVDVQIVPGVYLRSLAFAEYQKNGGKSPIEHIKFSFIGMMVPNDTLIWDSARNGFYKSNDPKKELCIQVEEVAALKNSILVTTKGSIKKSKPQKISATELDKHLPQKPPFRFAESYQILYGSYVVGSMQIRNPEQLDAAILEEFAAQTMSYHKSKKGNMKGFRTGTIGTFESSQTHFRDKLISELAIGSTIYVVGKDIIQETNRKVTGKNVPSKKDFTNIVIYSLFDSNGTLIGFGRLTGTIINWKTFKNIRTKVGRLNKR